MTEVAYNLPTLPIERWSLHVQLASPLHLPHLGSMLRGAFGHALKALACQCEGSQHQGCVYQQIFEPLAPAGWPQRFNNCPPAYVLTPPAGDARLRQAFCFDFTLLGPSLEHRGLIWQTWQAAATRGFGPNQIRARLMPGNPQNLAVPATGTRRISLQLISPMLLKRKVPGQAHSHPLGPQDLTLHDLLVALHRRLDIAQHLYGVPANLPPLADWLDQAAGIQLHTQLHDTHFARHSNRQQQSMPLYGLMGTLQLQGNMSQDLLAALALGQWLHIGGKTALGLGGYQIMTPQPPKLHFSQRD